ncbi:Syntaxin-like protein psy1 [Golovinomyces cichoracearum]|uniref:Syntaxin-like protein psy1 n=1 Tax=Golovinomyces cichoracearum TaxID=62708 RepID=A0A420J9T6_9PEZI|nr:Syntaxin-like protein psy1 [Golovinomyces cichoracearum]
MSSNRFSSYGGNTYDNASAVEIGLASNVRRNQAEEFKNYASSQDQSQAGPTQSTSLSQQDFLARIDFIKAEIRTLSSSIQEIASLHQRALSSPDSNSSVQLEDIVTKTQLKNTQIRDQIKYLEADLLKTQDGTKSVKIRQSKQIKSEFEKVLNDYRQEEIEYRRRYREQIARQFRIVNPDATDAEVEEASNLDWGSEGVFQTVLKGNRFGQATSALGAVRARHNELQRIEATLADLAALFADMAQLIETQDPAIEQIEQNAVQTTDHVDKANVQIESAKQSAARARKLKWYCLLVAVLIVMAIALGIGLGVGLSRASAKTAANVTNVEN